MVITKTAIAILIKSGSEKEITLCLCKFRLSDELHIGRFDFY